LFEEVGLFDEKFVAYFEDSDLSFRIRLAGEETALVPEEVAYCDGAASLDRQCWWRTKQCFRNHDLLVFKNMPIPLFLKYFLPFLRERGRQMAGLVSGARTEFGLAWALLLLAPTIGGIVLLVHHCLCAR
jgi:GT2 family glycosyltransferase